MLVKGLDQQRKQEVKRQMVEKRYEEVMERRIQEERESRVRKEEQERERFRGIFENASRKNDARVGYYLQRYYMPEKERQIRNSVVVKEGSEGAGRRKIRVMKKKCTPQENMYVDAAGKRSQDNADRYEINHY